MSAYSVYLHHAYLSQKGPLHLREEKTMTEHTSLYFDFHLVYRGMQNHDRLCDHRD